VLALITVAAVSQGTLLKGLIATVIGLMLSTVGLDVAGIPRFTLGFTQLYVGVPLIPIVIGLFALTEVFTQSGERLAKPIVLARVRLSHIFGFWPYAKKVGWKLFVKSSVIGALVGALPGAGASMESFLAYAEAKRSSKRPEKFGTGISEGIVAPEASNNAMTGGAFIPMLAFGIPGDSVTAIILGGLIIQGITPGPALFREAGTLVLPLMIGFILAYFVLLLLGLSFLPLFARLATVDQAILLPLIASVAMVAAFVSERSFFALGLTVGIGVLGYLLQRNGIPIIPVLLGVILGPILEQNFRRALTLSAGDPLVFVQSPISVVLLLSAILLAFYFGYVQPQQALLRNQSDQDDDTSEAT
jgi:putative tricarboxylic transport membrane protein